MKKIFSVLVLISVITSMMLPTFADQIAVSIPAIAGESLNADGSNAKISAEKAKEISIKFLKDYFDLTFDAKRSNTNIQFTKDYGSFTYSPSDTLNIWQINLQSDNDTRQISASVSVDSETGKIINVYKYEYSIRGDDQPKVAAITEEQAKEVARSFLDKLNPEESKLVLLDENGSTLMRNSSAQYYFRFIRVVNGLKFDNNVITIGVDGVTGKVSQYGYRWNSNITFPSLDGILEKAKAEEKLYEEAGTKLMYVSYRSKNNYGERPEAVKLVYSVDFKNGSLLDAKEGKMIDAVPVLMKALETKDLTDSERVQFISKWQGIGKLDKELDNSGAEKAIRSKIEDLYGAGYVINSVQYSDNTYYSGYIGKKTWSAQFYKKDTGMYGPPTGSISIDAATGQLVSINDFYNMGMQDTAEFTPKLTWSEAYNKAIDIIARNFPDKVKDIRTEQKYIKQTEYFNNVKMPETTYYFNFPRMANGMSYEENGIYINIDIRTGNIRNLNCNWDDKLVFPGVQGIMAEKDAKQALFKLLKPELVYTLINKSSDANKAEFEVKPVYILRSPGFYPMPAYIDAVTGKQLDFTGGEADNKTESFKKSIKGHWAEKQLNILAYQGIIDMDGFKLDKETTRLDAVKMLVNAKGYNPYMLRGADSLKFSNISQDNENYKYLQMAVYYGIIENTAGEFKIDEKITREELAELLVRLLKYNRLANAEDIFTLPYSDARDISPDKLGYVAISRGLGILKGSDGKFRPKDNVTMVELAVAAYNALDSLKNSSSL